MSAKKQSLGRGFESLIPTELLDESFDPTASQDERVSDLRHVKIADIEVDPNQPRRTFDDVSLAELAESIKNHGVLQPLVVVPSGDGFMIVAGERRFRASKMAGLAKVPVIIRTLSDQHKLEVSLIENLQRRDLNPLETATAYLKLRDQFNLTLDQIGDRVGGKSPASVSNTLRLLRLPQAVRQALADGLVREGQVRTLIGIESGVVEAILPRIIKEEWSAREVERYTAKLKNGEISVTNNKPVAPLARHTTQEKSLSKKFATKVHIRQMARGAGQIVFSYKDEDDLTRISKILNN